MDGDTSQRLVEITPSRASFRIHRSAYRSAEVFEQEKALIFGRCWLYLGHGTELKGKNDYLTRRVGGRDLISSAMARTRFVRCSTVAPTAGTPLCREAGGSSRNFTCPYHGWVFGNNGDLKSTNAVSGYSEDLNADGHLNLRPVPRLEHYRGFYFVNFNARAISLHDYLAGARAQIDAICDQSEDEQIILPGDHSYTVRANYKLLCENSYDGYHLSSVHASYIDFLRDQARRARRARQADHGRLHHAGPGTRAGQRPRSTRILRPDRSPGGRWIPPGTGESTGDRRQARLAGEQVRQGRRGLPSPRCRRTW